MMNKRKLFALFIWINHPLLAACDDGAIQCISGRSKTFGRTYRTSLAGCYPIAEDVYAAQRFCNTRENKGIDLCRSTGLDFGDGYVKDKVWSTWNKEWAVPQELRGKKEKKELDEYFKKRKELQNQKVTEKKKKSKS